jgi:hypothetical protein
VSSRAEAPLPGRPVSAVGALGAYGLRLEGLAGAARAMAPVPEGSPTLAVSCEPMTTGPAAARPSQVSALGADLRLLGGGRLRMSSGESRARFAFAQAPSADDLLHPYLAPAAALSQVWRGNEALHAGAFAAGGGAVLVLGAKQGGKSTTLAWIARQHGLPVLADDLAIIVDGAVLAGPRCLDLRSDAEIDPSALGDGRLVRARARRRIPLPGAPDRLPIAAIVALRWGARTGLDPLPVAQRLPALLPQRMFHAQLAIDPVAMLRLLGVPMWTLTRPRGEPGLAAGVTALLDQLA